MEDVQMQITNPLHIMDDEQLVSRMIIADREERISDFKMYRNEVMYRLRRGNLENWTPPSRWSSKKNGVHLGEAVTPTAPGDKQ